MAIERHEEAGVGRADDAPLLVEGDARLAGGAVERVVRRVEAGDGRRAVLGLEVLEKVLALGWSVPVQVERLPVDGQRDLGG